MNTLGINAAFHDSAACLVKDGDVIAAAEDERFTRIKHGKRPIPFSTYELPFAAIDYCLREAGITIHDIDHIAYSFDPYILLGEYAGKDTISLPLQPSNKGKSTLWHSVWDPLFLSSIVNAPRHLSGGVPLHLAKRLQNGEVKLKYRWHFVEHHTAHAASAYLPSPFNHAAVMTIDGRGERVTTSYSIGSGIELQRIGDVEIPHSLGILYEKLTEFLGFLHSSDEYKVMALASYGKPLYRDYFRSVIHILPKGKYEIKNYEFESRFGPKRKKGEKITQYHFDIAKSLQEVLEETVLELLSWFHAETQEDNLCLAGGVALNCVMNARIRDEGPFKQVWVQPASGDAGTALGAALWTDAKERGNKRRVFRMDTAYLGPQFNNDEIETYLKSVKAHYRKTDTVAEETAKLLAGNKIIGWFQGRMEFGPRALGSRSILASPLEPFMQNKLNALKDREDFRPVAPAVLEEEANKWFEPREPSPFMLFVHTVSGDKANRIPAVTHVDRTARIQTVNRKHNPLYYHVIKQFFKMTGVPVVVNTSFNTRSEPIVATPQDAVSCFYTSPLDVLVIGSYLLMK